MSVTTTEQNANPLAMSDEDIMNTPFPPESDTASEAEAVDDQGEEQVEDTGLEEQEFEESESDAEEIEDDSQEDSEEVADESEDSQDSDDDVFEDDDSDSVDESDDDASAVDYEAEYKRLMAPFKANGKDMQIDSVDDALQLMKMGAGFNKKMSALKPNLKYIKMLDKHSLLDESKLSFLIDLDKKNPDAIKKLLQDSEIDPLDVDLDSKDYTPNSYTVDDAEIELDTIFERIQDTGAFPRTIDIINNKWDETSRNIFADKPQLIELINSHIESGVFDKVTAEVEKQRMLGRYSDLSDIEAYRQVGDKLFAQPEAAKPAIRPTVQAKKRPDPKVANRKKAAASTKNAPSRNASKQSDFNPLALSDDEFEKLISDKFL